MPSILELRFENVLLEAFLKELLSECATHRCREEAEMAALLTASAPGKVLICGGYLVVESPNVGLSIGVSARFMTVLTEASMAPEEGELNVVVESPQFGAEFQYRVTAPSEDSVQVTQTAGPQSPFMYYSVLTTAAFMSTRGRIGSGKLRFVLKADNDFYSQRNYLESLGQPVSATTLRTVPKYNPLVGGVSKTGLGSSAALTTSFVACLAHALAQRDWIKAEVSTELVHRLAQTAHSVAQGKIGSGFDVYTAVYGTNVYVRFPASRVDALMGDKPPTEFAPSVVAKVVDQAVPWVPEAPVNLSGLPSGVHLMLADIHQGGSATPGMVSKIMAWRAKVAGTEGNLWDRLADANVQYLAAVSTLHAQSRDGAADYNAAVESLRRLPNAQWADAPETTATQAFKAARNAASLTRTLLREVGVAAGVEVEPTALTPLLDGTAALPGVLASGCPGAGGFDAVFALVVGNDEEIRAVEQFWETYSTLNVCPLLVREDPNGGLVIS